MLVLDKCLSVRRGLLNIRWYIARGILCAFATDIHHALEIWTQNMPQKLFVDRMTADTRPSASHRFLSEPRTSAVLTTTVVQRLPPNCIITPLRAPKVAELLSSSSQQNICSDSAATAPGGQDSPASRDHKRVVAYVQGTLTCRRQE